ncbi:MAG: class I SAM-dependent methyltransferase [Planctomycetota bacterium]
MTTTAYRWNQTDAATAYDAAAPHIHPHYHTVQAAVLKALPPGATQVVDLGGGSGRLAELVLAERPDTRLTVVDPSQAFLTLAEGRLARFGPRVRFVCLRAQDAWRDAVGTADAIVSTSALHHLEPAEKNSVFAECHAALQTGGVFVNGDEYRPPSDAAYRDELERWGEHMDSALAIGAIPPTFGPVLDRWRERNLDGFGGPRSSGDDCHETVEEQTARLYGAGFRAVETDWRESLWALLVARR